MSLNSNDFIRNHEQYDASKLSPPSIQNLYDQLLRQEISAQGAANKGQNRFLEVTEPDSRKRKASAPPTPTPDEASKDTQLMSQLVAKLYARYKEHLIDKIKTEERLFDALSDDIKKLEEVEKTAGDSNGVPASQQESTSDKSNLDIGKSNAEVFLPSISPPDATAGQQPPAQPNGDIKLDAVAAEQKGSFTEPAKPEAPAQGPISPGSSRATYPPLRQPSHPIAPSPGPASQPFPAVPHGGSPSPSFPPPPSSRHPPFQNGTPGQRQPVASPHSYPSARYSPGQGQPQSPVILPPPQGMQTPHMSPMQPPNAAGTGSRRSAGNVGAYQDPYHAAAQPYPQFASHGPWLGQQNQQHQNPYPHLSLYSSPYSAQPITGQQNVPPNRQINANPYGSQPRAQLTPEHSLPRPSSNGPGQQHATQWQQHPVNAGWPAQTPVSQRDASQTPQLRTYKSASPWKSEPSSVAQRKPQPSRGREVSPVDERRDYRRRLLDEKRRSSAIKRSEHDKSVESPPQSYYTEKGKLSARGRRRNRRTRADSAASSSILARSRSRSQSLASLSSENHHDRAQVKRVSGHAIKREPLSTPAPFPSDTDQSRTSTRRQGNTLQHENLSRSINRTRRGARDSESSSLPPPPTPQATSAPNRPVIDPSLVASTRNFSKISQPLMNDISRDKHASIFQKPITESMAPGYKSIIYRPQDLKSIKAAITAGNKAVMTAIEEQGLGGNTPAAGEAGSPVITPSAAGTAGKNFVLLKKTEDLVPPKSIVNPAQLEKELVRIFANAIMFNPLPKEERGFGNIRFDRRGNDDDEEEEEDDDTVGKRTWQTEEGALVRDTREMADGVLKMLGEWRDVEQGKPASGGLLGDFKAPSMRGGSITTSEVYGPEESAKEDNEADDGESFGGPRKRRKLGD